MRISVAVRTKFHAFQLAQQLHQRNVLHKLYTSFYGKFLHKDNSKGFTIPKGQVSQNWLTASLFYGFDTQNLAVFRYFGSWVASQMGNEDLIVSFPMISLPILQRAKILNIKTVISHASAHTITQKEILLTSYEKAGLHPKPLLKALTPERENLMLEEYAMADLIQVPSKFVEKTFIDNQIETKKLFYAPLGVDLGIFSPSPNAQNKITSQIFKIIYVGQLSIRKGIIDVLKAFTNLKLPQAELHLIGAIQDEIAPFLQFYTQNITYHGVLKHVEIAKKLQESHIFIINSVEDGFAQVVPQAMACGLPIICTENVGGADLVENGQNGFIIPIHDVITLQEKMLFFYENRAIAYEMGLSANLQVQENYTWDKYGEKCYEFYTKCLATEKN
jgi:glycosyltransferase involved in cell wall biosynthesis